MNNTLIIGIAVIAVLGIGAVLLTSDPEPVTVDNDMPDQEQELAQDTDPAAPPEDDGTMADATDDIETPEPETIVDLALANQELETLSAVVEAAGLTDTLDSEGPFTVLAPDDAAFADVPEETLDELTQPENIEDLQELLAMHVITGITTSDDLEDGMTVTTLANEELTVSVSDDGSVSIGGAAVTGPDVTADNGVIHIVDTVITDPA